MPQVDLDQDVLDFIENKAKGFGQTPSSVLRGLLGITEGGIHFGVDTLDVSQQATAEILQRSDPTIKNLADYSRKRQPGTAIQRYLEILSELYVADPGRFEKAEKVRGTKRIYFHRVRQILEDSGTRVKPEKISFSPYFAATNLSDKDKHRILTEVLNVLHIASDKAQIYLARLDCGWVGDVTSATLDNNDQI